MPPRLDDATQVDAGTTARIEDALTMPRPEVRNRVPSVKGDYWIRGRIVGFGPEIVSFTYPRS